MGGALWPEGHRYLSDTLWSNTAPARPLAVLRDRFLEAPSRKSLGVCVFPTGSQETGVLSDAAFSMTARMLILCYAIWKRPEHDEVNGTWHRETMALLDAFAEGHYVGESAEAPVCRINKRRV